MADQKAADGLDPCDRADFEAPGAKMLLHQAAHRLPFRRTHFPMEASIGDDLDMAVGQLHVNEYAIVLVSVPHAQLRKHIERARPRRHVVHDM